MQIGVAMCEHTSGSVGGSLSRHSALEHQDLAAPLLELKSDAEANHSGADDDSIPSLHKKIVANPEGWCESVDDPGLRGPLHRRRGGSVSLRSGVID